jgi:hypothetical protein
MTVVMADADAADEKPLPLYDYLYDASLSG